MPLELFFSWAGHADRTVDTEGLEGVGDLSGNRAAATGALSNLKSDRTGDYRARERVSRFSFSHSDREICPRFAIDERWA